MIFVTYLGNYLKINNKQENKKAKIETENETENETLRKTTRCACAKHKACLRAHATEEHELLHKERAVYTVRVRISEANLEWIRVLH